MSRIPSRLAVAVLLMSAVGAAWAERLLLVAGDVRAVMTAPHLCGQPVIVTVESARPELFHGDEPELQLLLDGVRAMLAFECPALREIEVRGRLRGMTTTLYRGVATRESGWQLDPLGSIRSEAAREVDEPPPADAATPTAGLAIAGLDTGLTVEAASSAVQEAFGGAPSFADASGVMTFAAGGCPPGYDPATVDASPQPGWKCLRGWFSREAQPRLLGFELIQATEHGSVDEVTALLEDRFGPARARWLEARGSGGLWGSEREVVYLAWGDVVSTTPVEGGPPRPTYELEAAVDRIDGVAVTVLKRSAVDALPVQPAPAGAAKADLTL